MTKRLKPVCAACGDTYSAKRANAGYHLCMLCGEDNARSERKHWTVAPLHKSNYFLCTDPDDLVGINNKGGLVK
jgi:ribosomal protein L37AE/L43A